MWCLGKLGKGLLMLSKPLIRVNGVSKCYAIFDKPEDRLKQFVVPKLLGLIRPLLPNINRTQYFREFWALKNVSLEIKKGEIIGIVGRNGSGKSTLLQLICGVLQPESGTIEKQGRLAALLELGAGFNPEFTGRENVYMNAAILGLSDKEISERFDDIVAFSEIAEFIDQPVKTYSSGMFMRLAFSVAVSVDADIVVVDEALAVGDIGFYMKCMQRIEEMIERGVTILLVTHDINLVRSMCSRVVYLRAGECVYVGDAETATEMFLMDVRGEQAGMLQQRMSFQPPLTKGSMAFGTGEGKLLSVDLSSKGQSKNWFYHGERINVEVIAWLSEKLRAPALAIAIRDNKGIVIFGFDSRRCERNLVTDSEGKVGCNFSFDTQLLPGDYNIAIRILDFPYGASDVLIEKQLNAVTFEVIDGEAVPIGSSGMVELNGDCILVDSSQR
jgi:lipopolysaccharide transport system ATP-binding protein